MVRKKADPKRELKRNTTKKERLALKEAKKAGNIKTKGERVAETNDIKERLLQYGLNPMFPAIAKLYEAIDRYVETGEPEASSLPFPECPPQPQGRNVVYSLPRTRGNRCTCDLIVRDGAAYLGDKFPRDQLPAPHEPVATAGRAERLDAPVYANGATDPIGDEAPQLVDANAARGAITSGGGGAEPAEGPEGMENFAVALQREIDRMKSQVGENLSPEEARALAEKMVPSAEQIQAEMERMYLPPSDSSSMQVKPVEVLE
jgi:hypothetical protein